jgi:mono/diheme cytochrome c family protein
VNPKHRTLVKLALVAAGLICATGYAAQNAQNSPAEPANNAQVAGHWKDPDEVYEKICKHCHDTGIGPELKGKKYSAQLTFAMVRVGPGAMPAFRQTDIDDAMLKKLGEWLQKSEAPNPPNSASPTYIAPPASITAPVKAKPTPNTSTPNTPTPK